MSSSKASFYKPTSNRSSILKSIKICHRKLVSVSLIYYSFGRLFYLFEFDYLQITSKIQAIWLNLRLQGRLPSLMVLTMQLLLATLSLILLISLVKFVHAFIWIPYRIQRHFKKQGVRGPGYRFITGNTAEFRLMFTEAASKPVPSLDHDIVNRVAPSYHKWSNLYGKPFLYWFGSVPRLVISDPDMIKEVLMNTGKSFEKLSLNPWLSVYMARDLLGLRVMNGRSTGESPTRPSRWSELR